VTGIIETMVRDSRAPAGTVRVAVVPSDNVAVSEPPSSRVSDCETSTPARVVVIGIIRKSSKGEDAELPVAVAEPEEFVPPPHAAVRRRNARSKNTRVRRISEM